MKALIFARLARLSRGGILPVGLLLCLAASGSGGALQARTGVMLTPELLNGASLGRSIEFLADPERRLRIKDIVQNGGAGLKFQALNQDDAHFGFGNPAAYWFRLQVDNPGTALREWVLDVDYVFLDRVVLYRPAPGLPNEYQAFATGDKRPFAEREIEHSSFAFRMQTPPGRHVYYLELHNPAQARFPVRAWSPTAFTAHRLLDWMSTGFIFGGLLILFISNLTLFAIVRNPAYLFLLAFIPGIALLYLLISGYGFQYLWPNAPGLNQGMIAVIALVAFGFVGYLRHLLETRILVPRLDRTLLVLLAICASFAFLNLFVPYSRLAPVAALAAVPVLGTLILAIFAVGIAAIGGDRPAGQFYLVGAGLFALTVGMAVLGLLDFAPASQSLSFIARLGSLVLTALMTVGVHYKIKLLRDNLQELNARRTSATPSPFTASAPAAGKRGQREQPIPNAGNGDQRPSISPTTASPSPTDPDDPDGTGGNWTIGPRMEQKLQQALFYLKENFRSDISREGLAAQLEVNPDNLGRFFLMYTGDKLGDYTNKLRIEAAARRLHEGDDILISDVAAEVGFENVSTFNRIFKKIMGSTPSDYRTKLKHSRLDPDIEAQSG